jgi:putative RNA 2'-phosphotransferase
MSKDPLVRRSKHLSLVLRHEPGSVGLTLDEHGWVDIAKLLPAMNLTRDQLDEVVNKNDKKRFELSLDGLRIRASQGHSVEVDLGYEEKAPPDQLFHGTSTKFLDVIMREGLKPMERHDVHLSADADTAMLVAKRRPPPVILEVASKQMSADGLKFRLSTNGVWLTSHVSPKYLSKR